MDRRRFPPDEEVAPRAWAGLAVVAAAMFVATLDAMVLYVAFGTIRRDFLDVSAAALSWILSGYTIVLAAGMIGAGRWADRLGRRRVFLAGMGVFTVASALCAVAPGVGVLVAARVLQGFGAAALTPTSLALILRAFPRSRGPQAIALWGAAGALAAALGPTIGGLFVEAWGWRSVFVVNVPIGIAVAIFGRRLLDESREPDGPRHRRARSPRACDRSVRRVGVVEYPDRGSAPRRCRAARRVRRTVRHRPELGAPARPLLRARLPLGEPRSASLRHGLHDHVFRQRPVSPRALGLLAGLDRVGDGAGATRRLPARPSVREARGTDRAASNPDSGRGHLRGRGTVPALASGFRSGLPRRLAALHARVGRRRLDGVAAAHVGRRRRPARRSLRHGLRRERRAPQPRTDARRCHLRGPGRTNDGR